LREQADEILRQKPESVDVDEPMGAADDGHSTRSTGVAAALWEFDSRPDAEGQVWPDWLRVAEPPSVCPPSDSTLKPLVFVLAIDQGAQ